MQSRLFRVHRCGPFLGALPEAAKESSFYVVHVSRDARGGGPEGAACPRGKGAVMGNVAFLGVEGAGKTVLTMALLRCFKAHEGEGWFLRPENNGAFRFLNQLPDELGAGNLPHQTQ